MSPEQSIPVSEALGSGNYVVEAGECMASIAVKTGHFWKKLWNLSENSSLKQKRKDPNILYPGDRVEVPPIQPRQESCDTERKHVFRRKGVPSVLRIQVFCLDEPVRNADYTLEIDGRLSSGKTDGEGKLEEHIPPDAKQGRLLVRDAQRELAYELNLGYMNPIDMLSGLKSRLANIGYEVGALDEQMNAQFELALREFQTKHDLDVTGEPDQATRDELQKLGV